jgi:hypothetical protein
MIISILVVIFVSFIELSPTFLPGYKMAETQIEFLNSLKSEHHSDQTKVYTVLVPCILPLKSFGLATVSS